MKRLIYFDRIYKKFKELLFVSKRIWIKAYAA